MYERVEPKSKRELEDDFTGKPFAEGFGSERAKFALGVVVQDILLRRV